MDVQSIIDVLSRFASQAGQAIKDKMTTEDLSNPEAMLKAQFAVQQYSNFINYESAIINMVKNMLSGIIAKI